MHGPDVVFTAGLAAQEMGMKKGFTLIELMIVIAIIAIIAAIAIPNLLASKIATNETAAVQNLKAVATAQAQFIKKQDFYATSGSLLNSTGTLIAADLKAAFELWQTNADGTASPKAGYVYRMLQGDDTTNLTSYWKDSTDITKGMNTWATTTRAAEPATSGENQYYITEAGTVYKNLEKTLSTDPLYKKFQLSCTPAQAQTSWTTAK